MSPVSALSAALLEGLRSARCLKRATPDTFIDVQSSLEDGKDDDTTTCSTCDSTTEETSEWKYVAEDFFSINQSQMCVAIASDYQNHEGAELIDGKDGFDSRWLLESKNEERIANSLSGDGTLENVGRNIAGLHRCAHCSQQFNCEVALRMHTKFMHEEVEQGEWLAFPSA